MDVLKWVWGFLMFLILIFAAAIEFGEAAQQNPFDDGKAPTCKVEKCEGKPGPQGPKGDPGDPPPNEESPLKHFDTQVPGWKFMGTFDSAQGLKGLIFYVPLTGEFILIHQEADGLYQEVRPPSEGEILHGTGRPRRVWSHAAILTDLKDRPDGFLFAWQATTGHLCMIPWRGYSRVKLPF